MYLLRLIEEKGEEILVTITLLVMVTCVFAQVIARYVFNTAITWTEELAGFCMVWSVYIGASLAVKERFHFRILAFLKLIPEKIAKIVVVLGDICWMIFCFLMLIYSYEYLLLLWEKVSISPSLGIDKKWAEMIVFIGYFLMILRLIQVYYLWFRSGMNGVPGVRPEDL